MRAGQRAAVEGDRRAAFVPSLDLTPHLYDGSHFDKAARLEIGRRLAEAWWSLAKDR